MRSQGDCSRLSLLLLIIPTVSSEDTTPWGDWFNPPRSLGPTVDYSTNPVYVVGDTTELHWTTVYSNYSIALWQQNPGGVYATLGPVIYRTSFACHRDDWEEHAADTYRKKCLSHRTTCSTGPSLRSGSICRSPIFSSFGCTRVPRHSRDQTPPKRSRQSHRAISTSPRRRKLLRQAQAPQARWQRLLLPLPILHHCLYLCPC